MKILILESRKLSYSSSGVFLMKICDILREYGAEVIHCIINNAEAESDLLESFINQRFDAVIDINSILPLAECDYGRYLDCIDAPFINIIVDHPMHVHEYLNVRLKRYYVICLDKYHKEYIEKYYPHIKKAVAIPLGGISVDEGCKEIYAEKNKSSKKYHILFPATYTPPEYYKSVMEEINVKYLNYAEGILSAVLNGSNTPVHDMYKNIVQCSDERFAAEMYKARYIDRYIRDYFRDAVISELLGAGFKVDVAGARWDMYDGKYKDRLVIHGECSYVEMLKMTAVSQIVLNVQPLFNEAPHDRIFNAVANNAAVLTDTCEYIEKRYSKDMLIYDKANLHDSIEGLCDVINDTEKLNEMSARLKNEAEGESWEKRCECILEFIRMSC